MKTALFTNFTDQDFTCSWDGKTKTLKAGQSLYMPDYLAEHYAKHLVNRELLRRDANGNLIYADGEKMTSPKHPRQVPIFMELFNKAYKADDSEDEGTVQDDVDALISTANKNRQEGVKESEKPQVILPPDDGDDEDSEESDFQGKPTE